MIRYYDRDIKINKFKGDDKFSLQIIQLSIYPSRVLYFFKQYYIFIIYKYYIFLKKIK